MAIAFSFYFVALLVYASSAFSLSLSLFTRYGASLQQSAGIWVLRCTLSLSACPSSYVLFYCVCGVDPHAQVDAAVV